MEPQRLTSKQQNYPELTFKKRLSLLSLAQTLVENCNTSLFEGETGVITGWLTRREVTAGRSEAAQDCFGPIPETVSHGSGSAQPGVIKTVVETKSVLRGLTRCGQKLVRSVNKVGHLSSSRTGH